MHRIVYLVDSIYSSLRSPSRWSDKILNTPHMFAFAAKEHENQKENYNNRQNDKLSIENRSILLLIYQFLKNHESQKLINMVIKIKSIES